VKEAADRGVWFDTAHGRMNFSFDVGKRVIEQGVLPHCISTDLTVPGRVMTVHSMTEMMTRFLGLGFTLPQVVTMCTANPAKAAGVADRLGSLAMGRQADISVLDIRPGDWMVYDVLGAGLRVDHAVSRSSPSRKGACSRPTGGPARGAGSRTGHCPRRPHPGRMLLMLVVPESSSLGFFMIAALVLLLTPGPAVLYIVTRSIDQGRRAGLVSVLGVHVGTLVHIFAAAAGISAVLAASAVAFSVVKYLGAAYLIFIGARRLLDHTRLGAAPPGEPTRLRRAFLDGVIVNVLNPKTGLFFLAFLPQFVTVSRGHVGEQIVALVWCSSCWARSRTRSMRSARASPPGGSAAAPLPGQRAVDLGQSLHRPGCGGRAVEQSAEVTGEPGPFLPVLLVVGSISPRRLTERAERRYTEGGQVGARSWVLQDVFLSPE